MADAQIAIIDGDQTQVVLAPGENPAIVSSIPGPQGPAGAGVPLGGTTNQVLFKQSGTNYDTAWGPITSAMIGDLEIVNADVSASAAIAGTKISPNFGSQTIQTTGVFSHALGTAGAPTITFTGDTNTGIYSPGADQLALSTNGTGRLFVDASGNIKVSTGEIFQTSASSYIRLDGGTGAGTGANVIVFGESHGSAPGRVAITAVGTGEILASTGGVERLRITSTGQLSHIGAGSSGSPAVSFSGSAPSNSFVIDSSGQAGLGTSSPGALLDISGSGNIVRLGDGTNTFDVRFKGPNNWAVQLNTSTDVFNIQRNSTPFVNVDGAGRVGIGTSAPATNLDVVVGSGTATQKLGSSSVTGGSYLNLHGASTSKTWFIGANYNYAGVLEFTQSTANGGTTPSSTPAMVLSAAGNVGIGTTSPSVILDVTPASDNAGGVNGVASGSFTSANRAAKLNLNFNSIWVTGTNQPLAFGTEGSERARIDSSGRLLVGTSSARTNFFNSTYGGIFQVETANNENGRVYSLTYGVAGIQGPILALAKHRTNTVGGIDPVISEDTLGAISFQGSDGSQFVESASIRANVDGTPGADDMPGRLVFSTTSDASASPTERLRITSAGVLQVADAGNIAVGTTTGTKIGTATTQKLGFFNKTPVVQPAAVADATDAASVITQLNALLARMRDLGLIAT